MCRRSSWPTSFSSSLGSNVLWARFSTDYSRLHPPRLFSSWCRVCHGQVQSSGKATSGKNIAVRIRLWDVPGSSRRGAQDLQVIGCLQVISSIADQQQYVKDYHSPAVPNICCAGWLLPTSCQGCRPPISSKIYSSRVKRKVSLYIFREKNAQRSAEPREERHIRYFLMLQRPRKYNIVRESGTWKYHSRDVSTGKGWENDYFLWIIWEPLILAASFPLGVSSFLWLWFKSACNSQSSTCMHIDGNKRLCQLSPSSKYVVKIFTTI